MTAADLLRFASAFADNKLLKDPVNKEVLLTKDANFANRALGFQMGGDGVGRGYKRPDLILAIVNDLTKSKDR